MKISTFVVLIQFVFSIGVILFLASSDVKLSLQAEAGIGLISAALIVMLGLLVPDKSKEEE